MANDDIRISFGDAIPDKSLGSAFGSISFTPPADPDLSSRVVLPRNWAQVANLPAPPLQADAFSLLAAYRESDEISVQVFATLLRFEVNLIDWLEFLAHRQGFTLLNVKSAETESGQTVHGVARAGDGAFLRFLTKGNGPKVVLLLGRAPFAAPDSVKEILGLAAASFEFTHLHRQKTRELLEVFTDAGGLFQVLHPSSWSHDTEDSLRPAKGGVNFRLTSDTDTLAYLRVAADTRIPPTESGMEQVFLLTVQEVEESGVVVDRLDPVPGGTLAKPKERWVGTCTLPSGKGEVALLFRRAPFGWLSAVMLCPGKTVNPVAWMRAKRAYEMVVASLSVPVVGTGQT